MNDRYPSEDEETICDCCQHRQVTSDIGSRKARINRDGEAMPFGRCVQMTQTIAVLDYLTIMIPLEPVRGCIPAFQRKVLNQQEEMAWSRRKKSWH